MKKIELLAPAGNLSKLKTAIHYGADAVYIGGKSFSLRARANNFSMMDIKEACRFTHERGKKVYVTMNIVPHNEDFEGLESYLDDLATMGVDAIITSSVHIMQTALVRIPSVEVHLSTQLSIANHQTCEYYRQLGIKRVVLARELDLKQIRAIRNHTSIGLEVFIHGGMCSSYSGRCMLSNHMVNRDANRGGCAHSCRWNYDFVSPTGENFPPFKIASKDLCAIAAIPEMIEMGLDSLKIEGRMKSDYYIATVVRAYRMMIDDYYQGTLSSFEAYYQEIAKAENRPFSTGFLFGNPSSEGHLYEESSTPTKEFVGVV
ncbi:MAG: U32 family peptidase, partial [Bacilli bacterium]|nr:U32 family peptidase [Bacilli bacterium]